jgi:hypothetical protein
MYTSGFLPLAKNFLFGGTVVDGEFSGPRNKSRLFNSSLILKRLVIYCSNGQWCPLCNSSNGLPLPQ